MGAYELSNSVGISAENKNCTEECIIAQKIFDQGRIQKCLSPAILGPARVAKTGNFCGELLCEGDIIVPPSNAASVTFTNFRIKSIEIIRKKESPLKTGCWDIDIRYVFTYRLVFYSADGTEICTIPATSIYNTKITLFGSTDSDVSVATDLYCCPENLLEGPFVNVEAKALGLKAELKYPHDSCGDCNCVCHCDCDHDCSSQSGCLSMRNNQMSSCCPPPTPPFGVAIAVDVTIGLFSVIKLFRPVNMSVISNGRCLPKEAVSPSSDDPCDFFDRLSFPMDLFMPPFKYESCCGTGDFSSPGCELNDDCNRGCDDSRCDSNRGCGDSRCDCNRGCGDSRRGCK